MATATQNICVQSLFSPDSSRYILQSHEREFFRHHIYPSLLKDNSPFQNASCVGQSFWLTEVEEFQEASISYWSPKEQSCSLLNPCIIMPPPTLLISLLPTFSLCTVSNPSCTHAKSGDYNCFGPTILNRLDSGLSSHPV